MVARQDRQIDRTNKTGRGCDRKGGGLSMPWTSIPEVLSRMVVLLYFSECTPTSYDLVKSGLSPALYRHDSAWYPVWNSHTSVLP